MRVVTVLHPHDLARPTPLAGFRSNGVVVPEGSDVAGHTDCSPLPVAGLFSVARLMRYRGLRRILAEADAVHVRTDPASALAYQVASLCRRLGLAMMIEVDHQAGRPAPMLWKIVARRTLLAADFAMARHSVGLTRLRQRGFAGHGVVAGAGLDGCVPVSSARPDLVTTRSLTLGLIAGLSTVTSGAADVLEAVAMSPGVVLQLADIGVHHRLSDRAAALGMQDRLRFVQPGAVLDGIDVLVTAPNPATAYRLPYDVLIERAHGAGIPVLCSDVAGLPEMVGPGGWVVPAGDAGAVFEVLRALRSEPDQVAARAALAVIHQNHRRAARTDAAAWLRPLAQSARRPVSNLAARAAPSAGAQATTRPAALP